MHQFVVERAIAALPEAIWRVLVDARTLANGNFGILRLEGRIALGESSGSGPPSLPSEPFL